MTAATATTPTRPRLLDRTLFWLGLFAAYAVAQAAIRVHFKTSIFGDEAELFLWARELAWGYGVQPPLYAWLQWGVNQVFGDGIVALAAMRALCLFGIYSAGFLLARRFGPVRLAGLAALALFLIPEISQTFLRTRTHNLLVSALVPLAVLAFLVLLDHRRPRDYLLFGVAAGLAVLAKATGAIFLLGLIGAALTLPDRREAVLTRRVLLTAGAAGLMLAGPALWSYANLDLATDSLAKFEPGGGWRVGIVSLGWAVVASVGFLAGFVALAAASTRRGSEVPDLDLFLRATGLSLLIIAAVVVATDSAEVKERWLVPIAAPLAPLAAVWVLNRRGWMRFLPSAAGAIVALGMLWSLPGYFRQNEPGPRTDFAALAEAMRTTGAVSMPIPDDMAAGVALADPALPVFERVDAGPVPCEGPILLAGWGDDIGLSAFLSRLPADCPAMAAPVRMVGQDSGKVALQVIEIRTSD